MKKLLNLLVLAVIIPAFVFTGCKDKTTPEPQEKGNFETLAGYLKSNGMDLPDLLTTPTNWIVAPELIAKGGIVDPADYTIPGYYVFDIRKADDFAKGHIKGSVNVALTDIIEKAKEVGKDKPILVVCYTGQTAARAVLALRMSGFSDAQVMKFGFSYWTSDLDFDKWSGKTLDGAGDQAVGSPNWVTDASEPLPSNDYPDWESNTTDAAQLLEERIDLMLATSTWNISASEPLEAPENYKIYNFWDETDYLTFGHYKGAYRLKPVSLEGDLVKALPQSDECLIYCYTGQTSAFVTAWLNVLGYNAKSILFGVNNLNYSALAEAGKPAWHHSKDYPYETGK